MDIRNFVANNFVDIAVGLAGCRSAGNFFESCGYDVIVFDDVQKPAEIISCDSDFVVVHHGSFTETRSSILLQYDSLQVIQDPSWNLYMLLAKIRARRARLFADFAKDRIVESMLCCQRARRFLGDSDIFASCWQKCASFYLADALSALNNKRSSTSHMLDTLRELPDNTINQHISIIPDTIGVERATPVLLERMFKSTIGFLDMIDMSDTSLIRSKFNSFISNRMFANCYFYLGYLNCSGLATLGIRVDPDMIHVLKTSFDIDADPNKTAKNFDLIQNSCVSLLDIMDDHI